MEGAVTSIPVGSQRLSQKKAVAPHIAGRSKGRSIFEINLDEEDRQTRPRANGAGRIRSHSRNHICHVFNITFAMCAEESDYQLFI
jgi:hypothetical protein